MPLTRAPGIAKVDLNKVVFPMRDTASGVTVECTVSEDALRKLLGGGSSITSLQEMFEKHRDLIEEFASRNYDRGETSPRVELDDVCALMSWAGMKTPEPTGRRYASWLHRLRDENRGWWVQITARRSYR
jgi:hypothetical protein